jgi:hypothetical protein
MLPRFVAKARSDWIEAIFVLITRAITWFSVEISPATGWPLRASNSRANDFPWLASTFSWIDYAIAGPFRPLLNER